MHPGSAWPMSFVGVTPCIGGDLAGVQMTCVRVDPRRKFRLRRVIEDGHCVGSLLEAGSLRGNESWVSTNICSTSTAGTCITHFNDTSSSSTNAVKVRVCYDHPLLVGLPGVIPNPLRMCSAATMRVINP